MRTNTRDELANAFRCIIRQSKYHTRVNVPSFGVVFYVVSAQSLARMLHNASASYDARRIAAKVSASGFAFGVLESANALQWSTDPIDTLTREATQYTNLSAA